MMKDFDRAVAFVLRVEGGPSNRPIADDPGGETVHGLSRRYNPDMPWPPTLEQARARYRLRYWDTVQGDALPWPVSICTFDAAVQHAPADAIKLLQVALRVEDDGILGPATLAALRERDPEEVAEEMIAQRAIYYPSLPNWKANCLGWVRRLLALHRVVLSA